MKCAVATMAMSVLLSGMAYSRAWGATDTMLGGTVRDLRGAPLSGAVVELIAPETGVVARVLTDNSGRYLFHVLNPGQYEVRASVAALLPALRSNLKLRAGSRAMADLTLAALFQAGTWLPAEHRSTAEPADDWRWTLRSTANRPLLRLTGVGDESKEEASSSSAERRSLATSHGQLSLVAGAGTFGEGGTHQIFLVDHDGGDGAGSVLRADLGSASIGFPSPSVGIDAGLQKALPFGGGTRLLVSMASHPEVQTADGAGVTLFRSAATEKLVFGDSVTADVGVLLTAERLATTQVQSAPYLRVKVSPSEGLDLEYRFATDRALQGSVDLDGASLPEEVLGDAHGRPVLRRSLHQALSVSAHTESTLVTVAVLQDHLASTSTQGSGVLGKEEQVGLPVIADPGTGTLRLVLPGVTGTGVRIAVRRSLGSAVEASVKAEAGPALWAGRDLEEVGDAPRSAHARTTGAVTGTVVMTAKQTGSRLLVSYRWQPARTLTQVDAFDTGLQQAYLGVQFRQKLWRVGRAKQVSGVVDATNLLAEGYVPTVGPDGQALSLAQVPRALQAGLAFSF